MEVTFLLVLKRGDELRFSLTDRADLDVSHFEKITMMFFFLKEMLYMPSFPMLLGEAKITPILMDVLLLITTRNVFYICPLFQFCWGEAKITPILMDVVIAYNKDNI